MKILQLAPQFPFPEIDGGKISISNTFKQFSKHHEVTIICIVKELPEQKQIEVAQTFGEVHIVKANLENDPKNILRSIARNQSIYLMKHSFPETILEVENIIKGRSFDLIHVDHTAMAPMAFHLNQRLNCILGLRLHNIENVIWYRYAEQFSFLNPKKWYLSYQANLLKQDESVYISHADVNFVMTSKEKERALELSPESKVRIVPAGVNLDEHKRDEIKRNPYQMIIATNYNWIHNVDGLKWFIKEVLPIVRKEISEAELILLGKHIPEWMKELKDQGVNAIGFVDSIIPHISSSSIYIAPLFVGGGIRIKILEAMSMELPIVATPVSAEGIEASERDGLFVTDDPNKQAEIIIDLMRSKEKVEKLSKAARIKMEKDYTWERSIQKMMDSYDEILNGESNDS